MGIKKNLVNPQAIPLCGIIEGKDMFSHAFKVDDRLMIQSVLAILVELQQIMSHAGMVGHDSVIIISLLRYHKVNAGPVLMRPMDQHTSPMFSGAFHEDKFSIRAGRLTFLVGFSQGCMHAGIDIRIVENIITEAAEVPVVVALKGHEPAVF